MRTVSIKLKDMAIANIQLGFQGENNATKVIFDCESVFTDYPEATQTLVVTPPEGDTYHALTARVGNDVVWIVSSDDVVYAGNGSIHLKFTENGSIIKSYNAYTTVMESGNSGGGGGGGTTDYEDLDNKPKIGGVTLSGNKLPSAFGIHSVPAGGSADQVLAKNSATDHDLKWVDQSGGGGAEIDDTAGEGDTDVVWSADKTWTETEGLKEAIAPVNNSTETGVDFDLSDENGNVILRLKNGNIQTKYFDSQKSNPQIITVTTTIRAAVAAAISAGASKSNPFVIQIPAGSYNILSEFTSEEIAESGFIGLLVDDGITLEGMGITRQHTVLYAEMDTTTYDQTKRNDVSTINLRGNVGLKNLNVKAKNIRYAVHDDKSFTSSEAKVRIIQNCDFFAESTTSGGYGNISFGAGTDGRKVFIFRECDFGDLVHIHTNTNAYPNLVIMENCKGYGLTATDYAATVDSHYYLYGCDFSWIRVDKGANWVSQHLFIHGTNRGTMVGGWDGMEYETGDTIRVQHPYGISSDPVAVAMRSASRYHIQPATGADDTIGICFRYDSTNDYAIVQKTGWVCAELLGFASPTIGNYLIVGSDGALSLSASDTGAIGKVFCANDAGEHFIKLNL